MTQRNIGDAEIVQPLVPYDDAIATVRAHFEALAPVETALEDAFDLVTAANATSAVDVPAYANSSMDGYAIRAADRTIDAANKVMTGWAIPDGCDAVVPWEQTETRDGSVFVTEPVVKGAYIRLVGEDVTAGATVVAAGTVLNAVHLGVLAATGHAWVSAIPKPQIAVLSTGDELVRAGKVLTEGTIYDVNSTMLPALLSPYATTTHTGMLPDERQTISDWLHVVAPDVDLIVTSGGASVGEHDWMRAVLETEGKLYLWRVAIRPGKPFALGEIDGTPVFVLPGNPASVLACSHAFVIPALRKLAGQSPEHDVVQAVLSTDVPKRDDRTFLCPVILDGENAVPARAGSSSVLTNQTDADGFAIIPADGVDAGETVTVELVG